MCDRMSMLEEEFPERAKELNDEVNERRKNRSETRKERKEKVDTGRTHSAPLANRRASVEEGKEESKKDKKTSKYKHACQCWSRDLL